MHHIIPHRPDWDYHVFDKAFSRQDGKEIVRVGDVAYEVSRYWMNDNQVKFEVGDTVEIGLSTYTITLISWKHKFFGGMFTELFLRPISCPFMIETDYFDTVFGNEIFMRAFWAGKNRDTLRLARLKKEYSPDPQHSTIADLGYTAGHLFQDPHYLIKTFNSVDYRYVEEDDGQEEE